MTNTLREIVENKQREVAARKLMACTSQPKPAAGTFLPSISQPGIKVIAEIKPKSPSAGELNSTVDLRAITCTYGRYAAAISVLTDEKYFGGTLEALRQVSAKAVLPTLCKDFILDEVQVDDAHSAGAEAVLLMVKILEQDKLVSLYQKIKSLNMLPVVEVQNEEELERALALSPQCILINNRNLETFEIDLATTERLAPKIPHTIKVISASGIEERADIERLSWFTNCFLIGSSLMRSADPDSKLRKLIGARTLVKTCGITSVADAENALSSGADMLGLIFVDESPRKVDTATARSIIDKVGGEQVVGVFKDRSAEEIEATRKSLGFKFVQLHGSESPDTVEALPGCIKAVLAASAGDIKLAADYSSAHYVLFDVAKGQHAITADTLVDWINQIDPPVPFLLAGGLKPDSVRKIARRVTAKNFIGVDVASGVELEPGVKSAELVRKFITEAKGDAVAR